MTKNVCRRFKLGHCKYGDKCKSTHNKLVCKDKNCNIFDCEKRHPKICKYMASYGRCKFTTYCDYSHEKQTDVKENSDKIREIENKLKNFEQIQENPTNDDLAKRVESKMEVLESNIHNLRKALEEKDAEMQYKIDCLEKKNKEETKLFENKIKELENNFEQRDKKNVERIQKLESSSQVKSEIKRKCTKCDFETVSERGLKVHIKRKHTSLNVEKFPQTCDMCEFEAKSKKELKSHRMSHSYIDAKYKCEDCEYVGENDDYVCTYWKIPF